VADGESVAIGHGYAEPRGEMRGGDSAEIAAQPRVKHAETVRLARPIRQAQQRDQRDHEIRARNRCR
jgi:hypothetical protein